MSTSTPGGTGLRSSSRLPAASPNLEGVPAKYVQAWDARMKEDCKDFDTSLAESSFASHIAIKTGLAIEQIARCPVVREDKTICGTILPWEPDGAFGLHCVACTARALLSADEGSEELARAGEAASKGVLADEDVREDVLAYYTDSVWIHGLGPV